MFNYMMYNNPFYMIGTICVFIGMGIMLMAQAKVSSSYSKFSRIQSSKGMTGEMVARAMLDSHGLQDVVINQVAGKMSDHYNPTNRTVNLSAGVYGQSTIAAVSIAAHEVGHAIQHSEGYQPLIFRNTILPICNIGQSVGWIAVMIGLAFSNPQIAWIGVIGMTGILLFQVATLPVEFDASSRALDVLQQRYLTTDEYAGAKSMLSAAAFTYVAAVASTLLSLLRIVLLIMGSSRDD